jgi:hypothetical protein
MLNTLLGAGDKYCLKYGRYVFPIVTISGTFSPDFILFARKL